MNKPCGCFTENTKILTDTGYVNIQDITLGMFVAAYDTLTGNTEFKEVITLYEREFTQVYKIYFGGDFVEATHEHPFYVNGRWVDAELLKAGDSLLLYSGNKVVIDSINFLQGNFKVYNFTVKDFHNYYVSQQAILVHNNDPCEFGNINDFFENSDIGEELRDVSKRTGKRFGKDQIMQLTEDVESLGLKKGDYYYLDSYHKGTELEVYDKSYRAKKVIDSNTGKLIESKTKAALEAARTIKNIIKGK